MSMKYPAGTRIRFPRTIDGESETQGLVIYAYAGEKGFIMGEGGVFPYSVKTDSWEATFGAKESDFEVIGEVER